MAHVIDTGRLTPNALRLLIMPASATPPHVDAVIGPFAADKELAMPLSAGAVISQRHLHGGCRSIPEPETDENTRSRPFGVNSATTTGKLEAQRMAARERHRVVQRSTADTPPRRFRPAVTAATQTDRTKHRAALQAVRRPQDTCLALTNIRGSALNSLFGENGIQ